MFHLLPGGFVSPSGFSLVSPTPSSNWTRYIFDSMGVPSLALCGAICESNDPACNMYAFDGETCFLGDKEHEQGTLDVGTLDQIYVASG